MTKFCIECGAAIYTIYDMSTTSSDICKGCEKDFKDRDDYEVMQEFYEFLQDKPFNLTAKKAFMIIYYLQEDLPIFPNHIEKCWRCGRLFDTWSEGLYWESKCRHYCGDCWGEVPENYDRGKR